MNQPTYLLSCHFATSLELLFVHFKDFRRGSLPKMTLQQFKMQMTLSRGAR